MPEQCACRMDRHSLLRQPASEGASQIVRVDILQPRLAATRFSRDTDVAVGLHMEGVETGCRVPLSLPSMIKKLYDSSHTGSRTRHFCRNRCKGQTKPARNGLIRIDAHAGFSPSALRSQLRRMETLLPAFQQSCEVSAPVPEGKAVVAADVTFFGGLLILC